MVICTLYKYLYSVILPSHVLLLFIIFCQLRFILSVSSVPERITDAPSAANAHAQPQHRYPGRAVIHPLRSPGGFVCFSSNPFLVNLTVGQLHGISTQRDSFKDHFAAVRRTHKVCFCVFLNESARCISPSATFNANKLAAIHSFFTDKPNISRSWFTLN